MADNNTLKQRVQKIYSTLSSFLKKDEEVRKKSKEILADTVKHEDEKKIEELHQKINSIDDNEVKNNKQ